MEKRVYNFSAGPSMLPLEVLEQAQRELVCYPSAGMSVMEMSHRSKTFENILEKAKADLKELMHIPDNYKILFLQGGGSTQFAMIPMNLMNKNNKADYVITGQWAKKAAAEAERYGKVNIVASSADSTFDHIPTLDPSKFDPEADYFYITLNNTIYAGRSFPIQAMCRWWAICPLPFSRRRLILQNSVFCMQGHRKTSAPQA